MTIRRRSLRFICRGLLAAASLCALGGNAVAADPPSSREYPPTYSSRKAPWYDPLRVFTSTDKKPQSIAAPTPTPAATAPAPVTPPPSPIIQSPIRPGASQEWKWYGYGAATPGSTPASAMFHSPKFNEVPITALPEPSPSKGVITPSPSSKIEPLVSMPADVGPRLPSPASTVNSNDVEWKTSAATLKLPSGDAPPKSTDAPLAKLKAPVVSESPASVAPAPAEKRFTPRTPAEAVRGPGPAAPDIPIVPAPGIVMPGK